MFVKQDPDRKKKEKEKVKHTYKTYRNLFTLMKESKQIYWTKYFKNNLNNNTWKCIKNEAIR